MEYSGENRQIGAEDLGSLARSFSASEEAEKRAS
jgi:hypothetical protein